MPGITGRVQISSTVHSLPHSIHLIQETHKEEICDGEGEGGGGFGCEGEHGFFLTGGKKVEVGFVTNGK